VGVARRVITVAVSSVVLVGCGRRSPAPSPPAVASAGSVAHHDRLAPGEIPPGVEKVFGFLLPRGAKVERDFGREVYAKVPLTPEEVATYVRERVPKADPVVGPEGTRFSDFKVDETPANGHLRMTIRSTGDGRTSLMILERWEDPPPPKPEPHDEVMRKAGLTPDGKQITMNGE
jgi:hypothetical protein